MNGPALIEMWWRDILTTSWSADARVLAPLLPPGIELDTYDGSAWLTVVPFRMTDVRVRGFPVVPGFARVPELNLRTYVRAGDRRGIYFFSLDADAPLAVRAARLTTGLPYLHAKITSQTTGDEIAFESERTHRAVRPGCFRARFRPTGDTFVPAAGTLEAFLHDRDRFFVRRADRIFAGDVRHEPWTLRRARIEIAENSLGDLAHHDLREPPACTFFTTALYVRASAVLPVFSRRSPARRTNASMPQPSKASDASSYV